MIVWPLEIWVLTWPLVEPGPSVRGVGWDRVTWAGDLDAGMASDGPGAFHQRLR